MKIIDLKKVVFSLCLAVMVLITFTNHSVASEVPTNTITITGKSYQVLDLPEDKLDREGFVVDEIEIQNVVVPVWKYADEENAVIYQMYLTNEKGEVSVYQYDASEQTIQRVYEDISGQPLLDYEDEVLWDKIEVYFAAIVFCALVIITIMIGPVRSPHRTMSKRKAEYIANKVEANYGEYELVVEEKSMQNEVKNEKQALVIDSIQKKMYMPVLKRPIYKSGMILVSWVPDESVQGYFVYRKTSSSKWKCIKKIYDRTTGYCIDNELCQGETYFYTVRAVINYGEEQILSEYDKSGVSETALMGYVPKTPPLLTVAQKDAGIEFTWNLVSEADYFSVYRKDNGGKWVKIYETDLGNETTFIDEEVFANIPYEYTVRASKVFNKKTYTSGYQDPGLKIMI